MRRLGRALHQFMAGMDVQAPSAAAGAREPVPSIAFMGNVKSVLKNVKAAFEVYNMHLLQHDGRRWNVVAAYPA